MVAVVVERLLLCMRLTCVSVNRCTWVPCCRVCTQTPQSIVDLHNQARALTWRSSNAIQRSYQAVALVQTASSAAPLAKPLPRLAHQPPTHPLAHSCRLALALPQSHPRRRQPVVPAQQQGLLYMTRKVVPAQQQGLLYMSRKVRTTVLPDHADLWKATSPKTCCGLLG